MSRNSWRALVTLETHPSLTLWVGYCRSKPSPYVRREIDFVRGKKRYKLADMGFSIAVRKGFLTALELSDMGFR